MECDSSSDSSIKIEEGVGARFEFDMAAEDSATAISCADRLEARAGRAQPGARDERVHRRDDPAMRTTGTPLGRIGRPPRLDQGIVWHGDERGEPISSRHAGHAARALFRPATCELIDA